MKQKKHKSITRIIFSVLSVLVAVGCVYIFLYAYSITANPDYITIGLGESYTLKGRTDDFVIRSYDAHIVTPHAGNSVIAIDKGDAIVGLRYSYFDRDFFRFKVIDAPQNISLDKKSLIMGENEETTIKAKCNIDSHEFPIKYSSTDEKVADVDENGKITAIKSGSCDIYAKVYNGISEKCTVTVLPQPKKLSLNHSSLELGKSEKIIIEPVFDKDEYSSDIEFSSSDESVAVVLNYNEVTAVGTGKCTITAKAHNGATAKCEVTVKNMPKKIKIVSLDECDIDTDLVFSIDMGENCTAYKKEIKISDENVLRQDENNPYLLHPVSKGKATISVTLSNSVTAEKEITVSDYKNAKINFDVLNQFPSLPTGCEVVSLTSVLNHYGFDVDMMTMADKYMPKMEHNYFYVSPHDYFYGLPYSYEQGMGCYPGCIVKTAENYFKDKNIDDYVALDISGKGTDEIFNYIKSGVPVITWVTSGFTYPNIEGSWSVSGETFNWYEREHCLVTSGYNENTDTVIVSDDAGGYTYTVNLDKFKEVFETMGSMAVVVMKK